MVIVVLIRKDKSTRTTHMFQKKKTNDHWLNTWQFFFVHSKIGFVNYIFFLQQEFIVWPSGHLHFKVFFFLHSSDNNLILISNYACKNYRKTKELSHRLLFYYGNCHMASCLLSNTDLTNAKSIDLLIFFFSFRNLKHETWKAGNVIKNRKLQHVRAEIGSLSVHCKEIKLFSIYWSLDNLYLDPSSL